MPDVFRRNWAHSVLFSLRARPQSARAPRRVRAFNNGGGCAGTSRNSRREGLARVEGAIPGGATSASASSTPGTSTSPSRSHQQLNTGLADPAGINASRPADTCFPASVRNSAGAPCHRCLIREHCSRRLSHGGVRDVRSHNQGDHHGGRHGRRDRARKLASTPNTHLER